MTPKRGRPPVKNPRENRITIRLSDEEVQSAEAARKKDKHPEKALSSWIARKIAEISAKLAGKK